MKPKRFSSMPFKNTFFLSRQCHKMILSSFICPVDKSLLNMPNKNVVPTTYNVSVKIYIENADYLRTFRFVYRES